MPDPQPLTDADRDELVAYLDGELDAAGRDRVEARLSRDPLARAEADALERTWQLLDYLPRPEPEPAFTARTLDRLAAVRPVRVGPPRDRRALRAVAWAAGLLAAVGVGYALGPRPKPAAVVVDVDTDPVLAAEPRLIANLPLYLAVEDLEYLRALDQSGLFGDEGSGR
jgi:anti-sigma factor RsiW